MRKENYEIIIISLVSSLDQCLRNNATRTDRGFSNSVMKEYFEKYSLRKGFVIDVNGMSKNKVFKIVEKHFLM